jgi:hypothetical protein
MLCLVNYLFLFEERWKTMPVSSRGRLLIFLLFNHFFYIVLHIDVVGRFGVIKRSWFVGHFVGRHLGLLFEDGFVENLLFGTKVVSDHEVTELLQELIIE